MSRPALRCARWCGRGCTEAEYRAARQTAARLARQLGRGWRPEVWENLGWHARAVSADGRLKVHLSRAGGRRSYAASLGPRESPGGRWAESARTAPAAVARVVAAAERELADLHAALRGVGRWTVRRRA